MEKNYKDITKEWMKLSDSLCKEISLSVFVYKNDKLYKVNNTNKIEFKNKERENGQWYIDIMGGELIYLPTIQEDGGVSCADYIHCVNKNKICYYLEEKEIIGNGKNVFYHALEGKENQASIFLIDCTNSNMNNEEIYSKINRVFTSKKTRYVEIIIVKKGDKLLGVFSRK